MNPKKDERPKKYPLKFWIVYFPKTEAYNYEIIFIVILNKNYL